jgi:AcrR family transcriptional regulator
VEEAITVFGSWGYTGGSLRKIAELVGVPASAIVALFGSKDGLLTAVFTQWDQQQVEEPERAGLASVLALRARIRYSQQNPHWVEFLSTLCAESTRVEHTAHDFFANRFETLADDLQANLLLAVERGELSSLKPDETREQARMLSAVMDGLQLQWLMNRQFDMIAAFDHYLDAALRRWGASGIPAGDGRRDPTA